MQQLFPNQRFYNSNHSCPLIMKNKMTFNFGVFNLSVDEHKIKLGFAPKTRYKNEKSLLISHLYKHTHTYLH